MQSLSFIKKSFLLILAGLVVSNGTVHAINPPPPNTVKTDFPYGKVIVGGLAGAALIRLVWKADPSKNPITTETLPDFLRELAEALSEGNITESTILSAKCIDDLLIGYKGKSDGIKVTGTSLAVEGNDIVANVSLSDGEEIRLVVKKGSPAYGFLGILANKLESLMKQWETFDKLYKFGTDEKGLFVRLCK